MRTVGRGFYWDELTVGEKFKTLNRTITDADIVNFIGVTGMVETIFTDLSFDEHHGAAMVGRVAPARRTGAGIGDRAGRASAGRTDQPSRHPLDRLA